MPNEPAWLYRKIQQQENTQKAQKTAFAFFCAFCGFCAFCVAFGCSIGARMPGLRVRPR